jgi:hypothetical protein
MKMCKGLRWAVAVAVWGAAWNMAVAGPKIDTSPDRAKTSLNPGLKLIGTITRIQGNTT